MRVRVSVKIGSQGKRGQGGDTVQGETGLLAASPIRLTAARLFGARRGRSRLFHVGVRTCRGLQVRNYSSAWISEISMTPGPAYTPKVGLRQAM